MNSSDQPIDSRLRRQELRLNELELQTMHLQRDLETINDVVLEHGRKLDQLADLIRQLTTRLESTRLKPEPEQSDEIPPHY